MFFKSVILFVVVLYSVMTFRILTVYAGFSINVEMIRLELCEKRNVPDSCCRGKCYLDKEMSKAEGSEENQNSTGNSFSKENLQVHTNESDDNRSNKILSREFSDINKSTSSISYKPASPPPRTII